jgi:hypothetical protein
MWRCFSSSSSNGSDEVAGIEYVTEVTSTSLMMVLLEANVTDLGFQTFFILLKNISCSRLS